MANTKKKLSPIYKQAISEGLTQEQALEQIYQAGKINNAASNKPVYELNALMQPFIFAAVMEQKYSKEEISEQTYMTVLNIIYLSNHIHGHFKANPSQLCDYTTISNLTKFPRSQLSRILKSLRVKGYINRTKGTDESISWRIRTNKQNYYYTLTNKGLDTVKKLGRLIQRKYRDFVTPNVLTNFEKYNFACKEVALVRHQFNAHRERFEYNNPSNQKLGLIVKDFKKRYPPKTEQNKKKF